MSEAANYGTVRGGGSNSITKIGGALGVAASMIGFAIFMVGCAGFGAVFPFAILPFVLAVIGLILTIAGGLANRTAGMEDTHVVASYFLNIASVLGALLLISVWRGWRFFA
jgi:hypothetical protein